jgi:hypothetical protein
LIEALDKDIGLRNGGFHGAYQGRNFHIPSDLVVNQWVSVGESSS